MTCSGRRPGAVAEDDDRRGLSHRDVPEVHDVQRAALPEHEPRAQAAPLRDGSPACARVEGSARSATHESDWHAGRARFDPGLHELTRL